MKKYLCLIISVIMAVSCFAACGESSQGEDSKVEEQSSAVETTTTEEETTTTTVSTTTPATTTKDSTTQEIAKASTTQETTKAATKETTKATTKATTKTTTKATTKKTTKATTKQTTKKKVTSEASTTSGNSTSYDKAKMDIANSTARYLYIMLNNEAADLIAEGEYVEDIRMERAVSVSSLYNSDNPILKYAYECMSDYPNKGYVLFDMVDGGVEFLLWAEDPAGTYLGEYPNY